MNKAAIIEKIKKCLALARSANEHEAAAAMRQAQKLMQAHGVTDLDVELADVTQINVRSGAKMSPAKWEASLAASVADTFGCRIVFATDGGAGYWRFIGVGSAAEIAGYAMDVMLRQVRHARAIYTLEKLKRCGPASKTRRADLYCEGWVYSAAGVVGKFANPEAVEAKLLRYMGERYPNMKKMDVRDRSAGRSLTDRDYGDLASGSIAGSRAKLDRGVGAAAAPLALE